MEEKIKIDTVLVYRDGVVLAERMVTSEMDSYLLTGILKAMNDAIVAYYNAKKEKCEE